MLPVLLIIGGFIAALFISELALKGTKLQTGLVKVLLVHGIVVILLLVYLVVARRHIFAALLIFWAGAFLTWFGVRSHMESSILLRMLYLLRRGPLPEGRLLQEYESHYGQSQRMEELLRGGLLEKTSSGLVATPKGKLILRVVSFLK
jgi:hypothetical protein